MAVRNHRRLSPVALAACLRDGCGAEQSGEGRSDRIVDLSKKPPLVNALVVEQGATSFLLTTNKGLFRVWPGGQPQRTRGTVSSDLGSSPVGTFLEMDEIRPGELVGSGHPDNARPLPPYLGFMRSRDGKTWPEGFTPRELVLDFVVDPDDPKHLLASTAKAPDKSTGGGDGWGPADQGGSPRLAWPERGTPMRTDEDGRFQVSGDGGEMWERRGHIDGGPYEVVSLSADRAFVALSDGTILETTDGGWPFEERCAP
jgi:hypothetical protein